MEYDDVLDVSNNIEIDLTNWEELTESETSDYSPDYDYSDSEEEPEPTRRPAKKKQTHKKVSKDVTPDNWGEADLEQFLISLKRHCTSFLFPHGFPYELSRQIHLDMPHRSLIEIAEAGMWFCSNAHKTKTEQDTMLDKWYDVADGMSPDSIEVSDFYYTAMRICKEEPFNQASTSSSQPPGTPQPDYEKLYGYLMAVFENKKDLPKLTGIEAKIMSDSIESMFQGSSCAELLKDSKEKGDKPKEKGGKSKEKESKSKEKQGMDVIEYLGHMHNFISRPSGVPASDCQADQTFMELFNHASVLNPFGIRRNIKFSKRRFRTSLHKDHSDA